MLDEFLDKVKYTKKRTGEKRNKKYNKKKGNISYRRDFITSRII